MHCHLLQCYVLYAVLNNLLRWSVCASTENLCIFIHDESYTTHLVISTLIAIQYLVWLHIQRVFLPVLHSLPILLL